MLNNQFLTEEVRRTLFELPYETKAEIFDKNCKDCPYQKYYVTQRDLYSVPCSSLDEAIILAKRFDSAIFRRCEFNGESFSLNEVIMNTCAFWSRTPASEDDEQFVELGERHFYSELILTDLEINKIQLLRVNR